MGIKWVDDAENTGATVGFTTDIDDWARADIELGQQEAWINLFFGIDDGVTLDDLKAAIEAVFAKLQERWDAQEGS